jgi:hypothetical protein
VLEAGRASGIRPASLCLHGWLEYAELEELHSLLVGSHLRVPRHLFSGKLAAAQALLCWLAFEPRGAAAFLQ